MARLSSMCFLLIIYILVQEATSQCMMRFNEKSHQELLKSQLQFSIDLLRTVGRLQSSDNMFFSPSSIYNALLLAYFVSANHTEDSLSKFLRIPAKQEKTDTLGAYKTEKYSKELRSIRAATYKLSNANRMYVSTDQKIEPCFKKQFMDEIRAVDFTMNLTNTIMLINNWVSEKTRNNINDLLSPDSLTTNTKLVLMNAAYFRGIWKHQFSPSETMEREFILANGTSVPVIMMSLASEFSHLMDEKLGSEVLELPYEGNDISMFILLPQKNSADAITDLLNKLEAGILQDIIDKLSNKTSYLSIFLPKFSIGQALELTPILEEMGVGDLFQNSADLSSLTGSVGLVLDAAIHKAKITVDETGTEAAAATSILPNRFGGDSIDFIDVNHPFIYFLFDKKSNILLFVGIFNSPET